MPISQVNMAAMSELTFKRSTTGTSAAVQQDLATQPLMEVLVADRRALALGPTMDILVGD
jgi:hypothetical protein